MQRLEFYRSRGFHCRWRNEEGTEEILIGSIEELYNEIEKSVQAGFQKRKNLLRF
jgi:hypothetical protein